MSYLLTIGKKVQQQVAPTRSVVVPAPQPVIESITLPVYTEPEPEPQPEPEHDDGASPLTDDCFNFTQESSEEQYASLPAPASTTSSHTEESSE